MKRKTKLVDPDIKKVDLVDKGAQPGSRFLIFKRDDEEHSSLVSKVLDAVVDMLRKWGLAPTSGGKEGGEKGTQDFSTTLSENVFEKEFREELWDFFCALQESLESIIKDGSLSLDEKLDMINGSIDQFAATVTSALPIWEKGATVFKAGRKIATDRLNRLKEARQLLDDIIADAEKTNSEGGSETSMGVEKLDLTKLPEDVRKQIEAIIAENEELKKKVVPPQSDSDILKNLPEPVRKIIEDSQAKAKSAEERAKNAEGEVQKMREETQKAHYISKAREFKNLGINPDEFGLTLKSIAEKSPEEYTKIEAVLKSADEAVAKGKLFSEIGSNAFSPSSVMKKVEEMAKEKIQKDGKLTKEQAIAKIFEENPALYEEYKKEGR